MNQQLIAAAGAGDTARVEALLGQGAAIDARDERGRTAVMAATHGNHVAVVTALVRAGADVDIRDDRLDNPFLYAGAEGLLEILRVVAPHANTRIVNRYGGIAIIPAAERGHVEVMRFLLEHTGSNVNHVNNLGWTALLEAIILADGGPRHQQIVELLLDHGADPTIADHDGITPLAHARRMGFGEIEQLLIAAGAR
ncbi:MAG: ankyrin repeat domain-containing protein [Dongiaceae bacterium]